MRPDMLIVNISSPKKLLTDLQPLVHFPVSYTSPVFEKPVSYSSPFSNLQSTQKPPAPHPKLPNFSKEKLPVT
jgi:hypothetical protein